MTLIVSLAIPASAATFGDVEVNAEHTPGGQTIHGYAEYIVEATNRSADAPHTVTLTLPAESSGFGGDHIYALRRTVTIGPGATARISLLQPPLPIQGNGLAIAIDGRTQRTTLPTGPFEHMRDARYGGRFRGGGGPDFDVLIGRRLNDRDVEDSFDRAFGGRSATTRLTGEREFIQSDRPVAAWSDQWLAYSRYDGIMLAADEASALPPGVRGALRGYIETGGALIIAGDWRPPAEWGAHRDRLDNGAVAHDMAFGRILVLEEPAPINWSADGWRIVRETIEATRRPWNQVRDVESANRAFPVVDELGVPVRGLFALILIFAVLIGPVNLVVLNRLNRRIWLLWTVPAVSLLFCGAVFAYNLLAEGWTGHSRTQLITVLDQPARRVATIGWTAYYAPLTPAGGLRFGYDTELTPQTDQRMRGRGGRPHTVDWSRQQHLAAGWITARVPAHFMVRRSHTERQRIDIQRGEDGELAATNGLAADIRTLRFIDADRRVYEAPAGGIPAGRRAALAPTGRVVPENIDRSSQTLRNAYASDWSSLFGPKTDPDNWALRPGEYLAVTETAAFLEPGLDGTRIRAAPSIVYGVTEHATR